MARKSRGGYEAWLRGGQTAGHTFDMTVEVIGKLALLIFAPWTILVLSLVMKHLSAAEQIAGIETMEASVLAKVGPPLTQTLSVKSADGTSRPVSVTAVAADPDVKPDADRFWRKSRGGGLIWLGGVFVLGFLTGTGFVVFGQDKMKTRQIRGQEIEPLVSLMKQIEVFNTHEARRFGTSNFRPPMLAGVPYPYRTELEHTLIVGAPGSGKSQAIHQLISSIRAKGERAIIFDPELDYIRHHYRSETDVILNPFDARSPGWSPFFDAKDSPDWVKLGHAIFKDPRSGDPYWVNVARTLFSWTGYQLMERQRKGGVEVTLTDALDYLFGPPRQLKALLEGTPAAMHLNGLEGARVSSLISVLAEGVEPLIYLHGAKGRFSVRNWVNGKPGPAAEVGPPAGGFLFLSAPESHMDALRPLLGFWSELAVSALLSRHGSGRETTWFILDEFHSAGRVDALADGPQRLRKYGGAVVLGFQQISQLHDLYGPDKARTIIGQCQTKLILRAGDFETATLMSEQLGRRVMRRVDENTSYGANSIRDGVGLIPKEELEPIMLPEDVQNFSKFEGAIRVSNARPDHPFPIARLKLSYVDRPLVAEGFEPGDSDPVRDYLTSVQLRAAAANGGQSAADQGQGAGAPAVGIDLSGTAGGGASGPDTEAPSSTEGVANSAALPVLSRRDRTQSEARGKPQTTPSNSAGSAEDPDPASEGGPEKAAEPAEVDDVVATELVSEPILEAKLSDLNDEEARKSRRRQEEDEREWARRDALLRSEPVELRAQISVYQRERAGDPLLDGEAEFLGSIEHVTAAEVRFAETHQHVALAEAGELLFDAVVGANGGIPAHETPDEPRSEPEGVAGEPPDGERASYDSAVGTPSARAAEPPGATTGPDHEDLAATAAPETPDLPLWRHRQEPALRLDVSAEAVRDLGDREGDREIELDQ